MRELLGPIVGFTFLAVTPAYAYVDPGAAMLAIQGLVGAVAVAGLFFRNAVSQLFGFLRPRKSEQNNTKEGQNDK